mgnify:CR=1 FL=1
MDYTEEEVEEVFNEAVTLITTAQPPNLTDADKLSLYGYYKQANEGKCNTKRPGMFDFTGKAKWDAWNAVGDMSKVDAMKRYSEEIHRLIPNWDPWKARAMDSQPKKGSSAPVVSIMQQEEDEEATTICDFAAEGNEAQVLAKLEAGVDANWTDSEGRTALHMAIDRNNIAISQILLKNGAKINAQDSEGSTPLHYAAICEYTEIINWLLENGADKAIRNAAGELPTDLFDFEKLKQ